MSKAPTKKAPKDSTGAALITGGAVRIGAAIARALAHQGMDIAIHYNSSADAAEALVAELSAGGTKAVALQADVLDEIQTTGLIAEAQAALGPLTCLINNASLFEYDDAATAPIDLWERHMACNARAPLVLSRAFNAMLPEGQDGNIINLIDQRVLRPNPHYLSYTASKATLWHLTRTLATALAPRVRVNAVGPGLALVNPAQDSKYYAQGRSKNPLERGTTPEEIADAVCFILASPAMTGQMIVLDGGQHLAWQTPDMIDPLL